MSWDLLKVLASAAGHAAADTAHPHDAHNTHLHEGRLGQPGVPGGPRNHFDGFTPSAPDRSPTITPTGTVHGGIDLTAGLAPSTVQQLTTAPETLQQAKVEAERGRSPRVGPTGLVHLWNPTPQGEAKGDAVLKALQGVARNKLQSTEGIHADPVAEALINFGATAGIGGLANLGRSAAETAGADVLGAGASEAAGAADSSSVVDRLISAAKAVKRAPTTAREAPQAVREAAEQLATKAGARAAAEKAAGSAAGQVLEHPKLAQVGGLGAVGAATGKKEGGLQIPGALVQGTGAAIVDNPIGVVQATGRGLAGAVTAPAALGYSAIDSAVHGNPDAFLNTAKGQGEGLLDLLGKLASGNPQTVQDTTENEVGLSLLAPLPHLLGTDRAGELADAVRGKANDLRGHANDVLGADVFRHDATGHDVGNVFAPFDRRRRRREVAEDAQLQTAGENLVGGKNALEAAKEARSVPGARSLHNVRGVETGDLLSTLGEYGISDPAHVDLLREKGPRPSAPEDRVKGDVDLGVVLDKIAEDPAIVAHPKVRQFIEQSLKREELNPHTRAGEGRRAKYLSQAALLGVQDAVHGVPLKAREFTEATTREGAWQDLEKSETRAKNLRTEARRKLASAQDLVPGDPLETPLHQRLRTFTDDQGNSTLHPEAQRRVEQLKAEATDLYTQARALEGRNKKLRGALDKYSRPGASVSSRARRKLWDDDLVKEMVDETKRRAQDPGPHLGREPGSVAPLEEPIFSHHGQLRAGEIEEAQGARGGNSKATTVQHVRSSPSDPTSLAYRDQVDRSFGAFLRGTYLDTHKRAGLQKYTRHFVSSKHIPLEVERDGKVVKKGAVTKDEANLARREGKLSKDTVWVPMSEARQPFVDATAEMASGTEGTVRREIEAHDARRKVESPRGFVFNKEDWKEHQAQVNPTRWLGENFINGVSRASGAVLLMSPAWVASQTIAELLPMVLSNPRAVLSPAYGVKLQKAIKEANEIDPRAAQHFAATMGEAAPRLRGRQDAPGYTPAHEDFANLPRALEHNPFVRWVFKSAKADPLFEFDHWRQGKYRTHLAAAELDKDLHGFFRGLKQTMLRQQKISAELKDMPLGQAMNEIATNPRYAKELAEMHHYVNDIAGNWHAFTRYERAFAPLSIFYSFARYAFRWPFAFARRHPMTATISALLGDQNANQIEKLLGGKQPNSFLDFAYPVVQNAQDESNVLPLGSRIAPGLSGFSQGVFEGNLPQAAVGSLNPAEAAVVAGVTGVDDFGEQHSGEDETLTAGLHLGLAAKALMTSPPLLRALGVGESHSQTSEELHANDPEHLLRSFAVPTLPESGKGFRANNEIIEGIEQYEAEKEANGGYPPSSSNSGLSGFSSSSGSSLEGFGGGSSSNSFDGFGG